MLAILIRTSDYIIRKQNKDKSCLAAKLSIGKSNLSRKAPECYHVCAAIIAVKDNFMIIRPPLVDEKLLQYHSKGKAKKGTRVEACISMHLYAPSHSRRECCLHMEILCHSPRSAR